VSDAAVPPRFIEADPHEEFFWKSGRDGHLRFLGCGACGRLHHPPLPRCPYCTSTDLEPVVVSGRATVATFTINHQAFVPGFDLPYVIGIVEIEEDPTIRLTTNLVGCEPHEVEIGQAVMVTFEPNGEWFVPLFTPVG
jgi:uncharacterized OB-fold protein